MRGPEVRLGLLGAGGGLGSNLTSPTPELESRMGFSRLNWVFHGAAGSPEDRPPPAAADARQRDSFAVGALLYLRRGVQLPSQFGGGGRDEDGKEPAEQETI